MIPKPNCNEDCAMYIMGIDVANLSKQFFAMLSTESKNQYLRTDCTGSQVDEGDCSSGYGVPEEVKNSFIWFCSSED